MKTLIVTRDAVQADLLRRTFFPNPEDRLNQTQVVARGTSILGIHFNVLILMPGWEGTTTEERELAYKWRKDCLMSRFADPCNVQTLRL